MSKELSTHKEYLSWFGELKKRIHSTQQRAALKVNQELLALYWFIGETLANKESNWGDKFIDNLAKDLKREFPEEKGFSKTNLKYMRRWYSFYNENITIGQQAVDQMKLSPDFSITQQAVEQIPDKVKADLGQQPVGLNFLYLLLCVNWGHQIQILTKTKSPEEAVFYLIKTIQNGWSRSRLLIEIENNTYEAQGKALTNFELTLPSPNSDYAQEMLKSPYTFELQTLAEDFKELELERALVSDIKSFLLNLGKGFAYVGNQYNLDVGGDDFFMDLLFYNTRLHCYVIFELKIGEFKPEYAGKLNFYQTAVDEQIKLEDDKPTIGVLLCKTPNKTVVEYALKRIHSPLGVAEYEIKKLVPKEFKAGLPTAKELKQELDKEIEIKKNPLDEKLDKLKSIIDKSGKDEVQLELGDVSYRTIVEKVFQPIKTKTEDLLKAKEIDKMYSALKYFYYKDNVGSLYGAGYYEGFLDDKIPQEIGLEIILEGFKQAGTKAFNSKFGFRIKLDPYKYAILIRGNGKFRKEWLYHQLPSEKELNEFTEMMVEGLLEDILRDAQRYLGEDMV